MDNSELLTRAVRFISNKHRIPCKGLLYRVNGQEIPYDIYGRITVPKELLSPAIYRITRDRTYPMIEIQCAPANLTKYSGGKEIPTNDHLIYKLSWISDHFEGYVDLISLPLSYRAAAVPQPNEEGIYVVLPPGSSLKACRK